MRSGCGWWLLLCLRLLFFVVALDDKPGHESLARLGRADRSMPCPIYTLRLLSRRGIQTFPPPDPEVTRDLIALE